MVKSRFGSLSGLVSGLVQGGSERAITLKRLNLVLITRWRSLLSWGSHGSRHREIALVWWSDSIMGWCARPCFSWNPKWLRIPHSFVGIASRGLEPDIAKASGSCWKSWKLLYSYLSVHSFGIRDDIDLVSLGLMNFVLLSFRQLFLKWLTCLKQGSRMRNTPERNPSQYCDAIVSVNRTNRRRAILHQTEVCYFHLYLVLFTRPIRRCSFWSFIYM